MQVAFKETVAAETGVPVEDIKVTSVTSAEEEETLLGESTGAGGVNVEFEVIPPKGVSVASVGSKITSSVASSGSSGFAAILVSKAKSAGVKIVVSGTTMAAPPKVFKSPSIHPVISMPEPPIEPSASPAAVSDQSGVVPSGGAFGDFSKPENPPGFFLPSKMKANETATGSQLLTHKNSKTQTPTAFFGQNSTAPSATAFFAPQGLEKPTAKSKSPTGIFMPTKKGSSTQQTGNPTGVFIPAKSVKLLSGPDHKPETPATTGLFVPKAASTKSTETTTGLFVPAKSSNKNTNKRSKSGTGFFLGEAQGGDLAKGPTELGPGDRSTPLVSPGL